MEAPAPDLIVVTAKHEEEQPAHAVEVRVTVQGSSLVTGATAFKKAKEVSRLVADLAGCGVAEDDIGLEGVSAEVTSGILGKSSSAAYRLRVRCGNLERLPEILGAITSAKNARLDGLDWQYPDSAEEQGGWLRTCLTAAHVKARAAAAALGTRLVGVHRMTELALHDPLPGYLDAGPPRGLGAPQARTAYAAASLGFELTHRRRAGLQVVVEYRLEGFAPP